MKTIDDSFIQKWNRQCDQLVANQEHYDLLLNRVKKDIKEKGTLSKPTFIEIINWKSPRIRPIFEKRSYPAYNRKIKECLQAHEEDKLPLLDDMYGIGAPVASTILHFIYSNDFPIIDIRTVETLYHFGYIKSKRATQKAYPEFRSAILEIRDRCNRRTLREIDIAIFTYHKVELSKQLNH